MSNPRIKTLQHLARIHLNPDEVQSLGQDLDKVFSWIGQLDSLCIHSIANEKRGIMSMREDILTDGNQVDLILRNAPDAQGSFFSVPKVLKS